LSRCGFRAKAEALRQATERTTQTARLRTPQAALDGLGAEFISDFFNDEVVEIDAIVSASFSFAKMDLPSLS
jgi:hypothetical protein